MLSAPLLTRRSFRPTCTRLESLAFTRLKNGSATKYKPGRGFRRPLNSEQQAKAADDVKSETAAQYTPQQGEDGSRNAVDQSSSEAAADQQTPSLIEQLFPEESKQYESTQATKQREIPRLPLDKLVRPARPVAPREPTRKERLLKPETSLSNSARLALAEREAEEAIKGEQISVLVLSKASKNLTVQDFRRLIPQGQHMEGWNLDQGSITNVIPARDLATLEHRGWYYLIFSSSLSAFVYQGHATRISRLVAEQTPNSLHNSLPPPPGYMLDGMDVDAAIQAYTLTPPTQKIDLRQLKPPLTPIVNAIIKYGGYPALVTRPDKMPYELRLTLEGPQLTIAAIRYIMRQSNRDRALGWSGGDSNEVIISQWEPIEHISDLSRNQQNARATQAIQPKAKVEDFKSGIDVLASGGESLQAPRTEHETPGYEDRGADQRQRTRNPVFIVGFHTEHAAQSFMRYWHRRPMEWGNEHKDEHGDIPPIANVETLW